MVCIEIILTSLVQYEDDSLTRILSGHHHVLSNRGIPCSGNGMHNSTFRYGDYDHVGL